MDTDSPDSAVLERAFPVLAVADVDAATAYYIDALGFVLVWAWGTPPVRVGLARDAVELQLVSAGTPGAPPGPTVVYCHVRGVAAYHATCVEGGAYVTGSPAAQAFGLLDFRVQDLDGNILGFGEPCATA